MTRLTAASMRNRWRRSLRRVVPHPLGPPVCADGIWQNRPRMGGRSEGSMEGRIMRKPIAVIAVGIALAAWLSFGCASSLMQPAEDPAMPPLSSDASRIVFLRPSHWGGAIQTSLYDVTQKSPEFLGVLSAGRKIVLDTSPGAHRFMVVSEHADFMDAQLAPGRTYYAVVGYRVGFWNGQFPLWPVKAAADAPYSLQDDDFDEWLEAAEPVVKTAAADEWARDHLVDVQSKYDAYLPVWAPQPTEERP